MDVKLTYVHVFTSRRTAKMVQFGFQTWDTDGDGVIGLDELKKMKSLLWNTSAEVPIILQGKYVRNLVPVSRATKVIPWKTNRLK